MCATMHPSLSPRETPNQLSRHIDTSLITFRSPFTATCRTSTLRSSMYRATTCIVSERQTAHCIENSCAVVPVTVCHQSGNDLDGLLVSCTRISIEVTRTKPKTSYTCIQTTRMAPFLAFRVNQLHQKPRLRESLRPLSILASGVPRTTTWPVRGSSQPHQPTFHEFHDRSATMRGIVGVQVCCRGLRSGKGKCGQLRRQQEEDMCNMRMIFAGTLATWASEPNGSTTTHDA